MTEKANSNINQKESLKRLIGRAERGWFEAGLIFQEKIEINAVKKYPKYPNGKNHPIDATYGKKRLAYILGANFGFSLAEKEIAEKDRVIAELNLALNEAEKKIKQLDTKPY